jgi:hypothetical protein
MRSLSRFNVRAKPALQTDFFNPVGQLTGLIENFVAFRRLVNTWILHESEDCICKACKGVAIVNYCKPLLTPQMEASDSPEG